MNSVLPKTKTVTYKQKSGVKPDWTNPEFANKGGPTQIESYRVPCEGDSGSGQVFSTQYLDRQTSVEHTKFVLAAVLSGGITDGFFHKPFLAKEKRHSLPCGSYTYSRKLGKYIQDTSYSHSTTFSGTFNWIKTQIKT